jgi:hypothetical protein
MFTTRWVRYATLGPTCQGTFVHGTCDKSSIPHAGIVPIRPREISPSNSMEFAT